MLDFSQVWNKVGGMVGEITPTSKHVTYRRATCII